MSAEWTTICEPFVDGPARWYAQQDGRTVVAASEAELLTRVWELELRTPTSALEQFERPYTQAAAEARALDERDDAFGELF